MIVRVKSKDGPNLFIPFPLGLICNRFTAGIAVRSLSGMGISASAAQLACLFRALKRYKRKHPDWVLAEVQSADGDYVYVKL